MLIFKNVIQKSFLFNRALVIDLFFSVNFT